jgi:catalase
MATPIPYSATTESVPADEMTDIVRIVEILQRTLQLHHEKTGERQRDVHAKSHGCARAEFTVLGGLRNELSQGLFASPGNYPAVVRFSNAAPWIQSDILPDGRGLAVQVENVPADPAAGDAATQDFIMVNHPSFLARDVKEYLRLEEARLRANDQPIMVAAALARDVWNTGHVEWREMAAAVGVATQFPAHPANYAYYSMSPFRYGDYVAKYRVKVEGTVPGSMVDSATQFATQRDAMRHLLEKTLESHELAFEFQVQLRTSEETMPIEDAAVVWPEAESPFETVARLVLPRQGLANNDDYEQRSFSVWNTLAAHRPLGGINRARKVAYPISANFRNLRS